MHLDDSLDIKVLNCNHLKSPFNIYQAYNQSDNSDQQVRSLHVNCLTKFLEPSISILRSDLSWVITVVSEPLSSHPVG